MAQIVAPGRRGPFPARAALAIACSLRFCSGRVLEPYGSVFFSSANEWEFYGIGGVVYDPVTQVWTGITEGNPGAGRQNYMSASRVVSFRVDWRNGSTDGELTVLSSETVKPTEGLKTEGIAVACLRPEPQFWLASEANSDTRSTSSFFSKNFGQPDQNTFAPGSFRNSRLVRVAADGDLLQEVELPNFLLWDGRNDWDPTKCHGNRVLKGLHTVSRTEKGMGPTMVTIPQLNLYQDGGEPTEYEGADVRILFWDVSGPGAATGDCSAGVPSTRYSRSYRYRLTRKVIDTWQKGALHVRGVFGVLAISETELLVTETELLEGFNVETFINDVFYVQLDPNATVDHCSSLADCDVAAPEKKHLLRRNHHYELSDLSWGPDVQVDGVTRQTVAMPYENDDAIGLLMELYTLNLADLASVPTWQDDVDKSSFLAWRFTVLGLGCALAVCVWVAQFVIVRLRGAQAQQPQRPWGYKDFVMGSCIANSTLLGGFTFGFPALVLILRQENVYAENCSCGVFCAGQQERMAILSTLGFLTSIGSRIVAGLVLDHLGPKITAVSTCFVCFFGCLGLASAPDPSDAILICWLMLAFGGSGLHVTSFHATNLFSGGTKKAVSSLISCGFGASSLILPVLQLLNQGAGLSLRGMMACYAVLCLVLAASNFIHQPWVAWKKPDSEAVLDFEFWRKEWWQGLWQLFGRAEAGGSSSDGMPLRDVLTSFEFWGECAWFSVNLMLVTYYLSTVSQILFSLGDALINSTHPSSWENYVYTRCASLFNGFGFLWFPVVSTLQREKSQVTCFTVQICLGLVMSVSLMLPFLELQVMTFALQSLVRLMVLSFHFSYLAERFGFRHFGLLNGISSLCAGLVGFLGYPLQVFSVYVANGNYGMSYIFVTVGVFLTFSFPAALRARDRRRSRAAPKEAAAAAEEQPPAGQRA